MFDTHASNSQTINTPIPNIVKCNYCGIQMVVVKEYNDLLCFICYHCGGRCIIDIPSDGCGNTLYSSKKATVTWDKIKVKVKQG
jgi:hypothetical protein